MFCYKANGHGFTGHVCSCAQKCYTDREDCVNVSRASVQLNSTNCDMLIASFPPALILTDRFTAKCQMLHTVYIEY